MSGDEFLVLIGSCGVVFIFWSRWIRDIMMIYDRRGRYAGIAAVIAPFVALGVLFLVLKNFASFDVKSSSIYLAFYMALGFAWCGLMTKCFAFLGFDFRHDVAEQDNYAADIALSGAVLGSMLCFSGGNIGDGPGWWVVMFCAVIATAAWMLIWIILDQVNGVCEAITVDHDLATGIRFSGLLIAAGLVLGRAVAGNWVSYEATWGDFLRLSTPLIILVVVAAAVDYALRLSKDAPMRGVVMAGFLPAAGYLSLAGFYVKSLGAW